MSLYPNPARDYATIEAKPNQEIQIFNLQGSAVKSFMSVGHNVVDVSSFPSGVYLVKMGLVIKKLIVR